MRRTVFAQCASERPAEKGVEMGLGRESASVRYVSDGKVRVLELSAHLLELLPPYGGGDAFAVHRAEPQFKKTARDVQCGGKALECQSFRGGRQSAACVQTD